MCSAFIIERCQLAFPAFPDDKMEKIGLPIIGEGEAEAAAGRKKVKLALGVTQIEDRTAGSYIMVRPKGTTPLIGVEALGTDGLQSRPNKRKTYQRTTINAVNSQIEAWTLKDSSKSKEG